MKLQQKAFTLVELIVVITILAILATIAFISIQGYTKDARDSTRVADLKSIENTFELFHIETNYYPQPDSGSIITFSGAEIWTQGTVGDSVRTNLKRLSDKPTDPLTLNEYTYSRLNTKQEYELGTIIEGNIAYDNGLFNKVNALGTKIANAKIIGNYNGLFASVHTGSTDYILSVPSIIGTDLSDGIYLHMVNGNKISCNGYSKLPSKYSASSFNVNGNNANLDFVKKLESELVVFSGAINTLKTSDTLGDITRETFVTNLKNSYTGVSGICNGAVTKLLTQDPATSFEYNKILVNNNLNGKLSTTNIAAILPPCVFGSSSFGNCSFQ